MKLPAESFLVDHGVREKNAGGSVEPSSAAFDCGSGLDRSEEPDW
jgi:hypothetical protein